MFTKRMTAVLVVILVLVSGIYLVLPEEATDEPETNATATPLPPSPTPAPTLTPSDVPYDTPVAVTVEAPATATEVLSATPDTEFTATPESETDLIPTSTDSAPPLEGTFTPTSAVTEGSPTPTDDLLPTEEITATSDGSTTVWMPTASPTATVAASDSIILMEGIMLEQGQSDTVHVYIDCRVAQCRYFDFTIAFDPTLIEITAVRGGGMYAENEDSPATFIVDAEAGYLFGALGPLEIGDQTGLLFEFDLLARAAGTSPLRFDHLMVGGAGAAPLAAVGPESWVTILPGDADPLDPPTSEAERTPEVTAEITPTLEPTATLTPTCVPPTESLVRRADVDGSGHVDQRDIALVQQVYGTTEAVPGLFADVNADGIVNILDLLLVASNIGLSITPVSLTVDTTCGDVAQ